MTVPSPTSLPVIPTVFVPIEPASVVTTSNPPSATTPVFGRTSLIEAELAPNGSPYWSVVTNVTGNVLI